MPIREDGEPNESGLSRSEAESAFLTKWQPDDPKDSSDPKKGAKAPKEVEETPPEEADDDNEELIEDDDPQDDEDQSDDDEEQETIAGDNAKVEIVIDGEKKTASVKDLKRLYGQEAALTRKSQEVAAKRKEAEDTAARHRTATEKLFENAKKRYAPYEGIDFLVASTQLDPEEFKALRNAAAAAYEDLKFLATELDTADKAAAEAKGKEWTEKAKAAIAFLENPETGIKGFNPDLYKSIGDFAVSQGMSAEDFYGLTDPRLIKLIHQAMRYDAAKKVTLKKKAESPQKVIKAKKSSDPNRRTTRGGDADNALKKLRATGTRQDAADAFLARWSDGSDD